MTPQFETDFRNRLTGTGTGSSPVQRFAKTKVLELDQYEVVLAMTEDDHVLAITEVRVKKDFRSLQQKLGSTGYIDVEQYLK
jgi:hypothetical protein